MYDGLITVDIHLLYPKSNSVILPMPGKSKTEFPVLADLPVIMNFTGVWWLAVAGTIKSRCWTEFILSVFISSRGPEQGIRPTGFEADDWHTTVRRQGTDYQLLPSVVFSSGAPGNYLRFIIDCLNSSMESDHQNKSFRGKSPMAITTIAVRRLSGNPAVVWQHSLANQVGKRILDHILTTSSAVIVWCWTSYWRALCVSTIDVFWYEIDGNPFYGEIRSCMCWRSAGLFIIYPLPETISAEPCSTFPKSCPITIQFL